MTDRDAMGAHDEFYYSRDHDGGPGAWCVRGPNGFMIRVDDKNCAYILGKILSNRYSEADDMAQNVRESAASIFGAYRSSCYADREPDRE